MLVIEFPSYDPAARALALRERILESLTRAELEEYLSNRAARYNEAVAVALNVYAAVLDDSKDSSPRVIG